MFWFLIFLLSGHVLYDVRLGFLWSSHNCTAAYLLMSGKVGTDLLESETESLSIASHC